MNKLTCALMRACDGVFACCCIAHTHTHTHAHAHTCAHSPSLCSPCASECQAGAPQDPGHLTENPLHLTNWASASLWPGNRERGCALCACFYNPTLLSMSSPPPACFCTAAFLVCASRANDAAPPLTALCHVHPQVPLLFKCLSPHQVISLVFPCTLQQTVQRVCALCALRCGCVYPCVCCACACACACGCVPVCVCVPVPVCVCVCCAVCIAL